MDKTTGKEGKGVKGTGFEGETGSNSYSQLPASSNANLGIDADVAAGYSESARTPQSTGLNVGSDTSSQGEDNMSNAKFGIGDDIAAGTVPSRRMDDVVNAAGPAPRFGVSAKSGGAKMLNPDEYYGSGSRKEGTAQSGGVPGRAGSMAMAIKGLSGSTGGMPANEQAAQGAQKSKDKSRSGLSGSGGAGNNDRS